MKTCGRLLLLSIFCLMILPVMAQEPADSNTVQDDDPEVLVTPDVNPDSKLGIKLGTGATQVTGSSAYHAYVALYLTGGLYYRFKLKPHIMLQPEFVITYKGSNFSNSSGELGGLKTYYLELPVLLMKGLNDLNTTCLVGGIQYSRLLNALEYTVGGVVPEGTNPKIHHDDIMLIVGTQFHTPFVGFQCLLKGGLHEVNNGMIDTIGPNVDGKPMHHITFEVTMFF